jgi:hypothetical protein
MQKDDAPIHSEIFHIVLCYFVYGYSLQVAKQKELNFRDIAPQDNMTPMYNRRSVFLLSTALWIFLSLLSSACAKHIQMKNQTSTEAMQSDASLKSSWSWSWPQGIKWEKGAGDRSASATLRSSASPVHNNDGVVDSKAEHNFSETHRTLQDSFSSRHRAALTYSASVRKKQRIGCEQKTMHRLYAENDRRLSGLSLAESFTIGDEPFVKKHGLGSSLTRESNADHEDSESSSSEKMGVQRAPETTMMAEWVRAPARRGVRRAEMMMMMMMMMMMTPALGKRGGRGMEMTTTMTTTMMTTTMMMGQLQPHLQWYPHQLLWVGQLQHL